MSKSKLTLLVDGNWLLMSRLFVINSKYTDEDELIEELKLLMIKSINVVLRQFPEIDNIILVSDGGSWRNFLDKPSFIVDEYKGNREKSDDINWDKIFESFNDFQNSLKETGITCVHENGIEGDDWAWFWSNHLNKENTNVIIWTKDKDLTQLVKTDKNKCFTIWWNKDNGIFCEDTDDGELDFLFNSKFSENEQLLNSLFNKENKITKINPNSVILDKIIRGDASDNILPILLRTAKPNKQGIVESEKVYRISYKDIPDKLDIYNEEDIRNYVERIISSKPYFGRIKSNKSVNDIVEHFKYNVKLVCLNECNYPEEIIEKLSNYGYYTCCKDTSIVESQLIAKKNSLTSVLDFI